jgi:hypothetical protein
MTTNKEVMLRAIAEYSATAPEEWVWYQGSECRGTADYCFQTRSKDPERVMSARARIEPGQAVRLRVARGLDIPAFDDAPDEFSVVAVRAPMPVIERMAKASRRRRVRDE